MYTLENPFQSTHPVRGGTAEPWRMYPAERFQSTHPVRGGTSSAPERCSTPANFNPPTPCGVGQKVRSHILHHRNFNPPTPCGVGRSWYCPRASTTLFQSTHPVRGGTRSSCRPPPRRMISIHPPRAGWDRIRDGHTRLVQDFNPPTPCGVGLQFLQRFLPQSSISIHPPRAGWDWAACITSRSHLNFNPPTPCGVGP